MFKKVIAEMPEARLWFVGGGVDPEDEAILHREIRKEEIAADTVRFFGAIPMDEVWQHIEKSAVCLSPIYPSFIFDQGSPTKLIEYMAMGRPVIANDQPEQVQVIGESGAGICLPWNETAFADATLKLLRDPVLAQQMGARGRAWVERNRTSAIMADIVESKYYELLKDRRHE
jgi:glycosyltransferase involved in cell wall biosynthesis